jgi:hypothetical protein
MGITKPNANTKGITDSLNLKSENLTKKDVVILCSGTRDIAKNETNIGLRYISQFANTTATTNVIVAYAPMSFDLQPTSCVNKEVATFNRKLQKTIKIHSHVKLCPMSTIRDHFTTHGLHMNTRGKDWITNTWASIIKTLQTNSRTTPIIPLPEKISCIKNSHFSISQNSKNSTTMKGEQEKERTTEVPCK